jgi:beta-lactamase class C
MNVFVPAPTNRSKRVRAIALFGMSLCFACWAASSRYAAAQQQQQQQPRRPAVAAPQGLAATVHRVMRPWIARQQPPGVVVVVHHQGTTQFFSYGEADKGRRTPVTADSIFELASITKVFCSTSLALEVDAGEMRLTDSVAGYFPLLESQGGDIKRVTLEQLATHTSSLPRTPPGKPPGPDWTTRSLVQWLVGWRAPYPPGSRSLYSNIGFGMLGEAIAQRERQPLIDVWRRQFLDPLGMRSTFFEVPADRAKQLVQGYGPKGAPVAHAGTGGWPAGGRLKSSGRDMAAFLVANLGERPDLPRVSKAMRLTQQPFYKASAKMVQGLAWQRVHFDNELMVDKNGGLAGTSTWIGMLPAEHLGVVVLANRGKCSATAVGRQLLLELAGRQQQNDLPAPGDEDAEDP